MADQRNGSGARGDEADLFRAFHDDLVSAVAGSVRGSTPEVLEDACSFAWAQFMQHQPGREGNWQGWLFRTAQREAFEHRPLRTNDDESIFAFQEVVDPHDYQAINTDVGDALSILEQLPLRLQRIAMLRALGLHYSEIGELTGDSRTRVEALVARANLEIREILTERAFNEHGQSPRAERLWQLEHEQPAWLVDKVGRVPRATRRSLPQSELRRIWRRAALALDDLRTLVGPARLDDALATRPRETRAATTTRARRRAIEDLEHHRSPDRSPRIGD